MFVIQAGSSVAVVRALLLEVTWAAIRDVTTRGRLALVNGPPMRYGAR